MNLWRNRIVVSMLAITMIISSLQFSTYDVNAQETAIEATYVTAEADEGEVSSLLASDEDAPEAEEESEAVEQDSTSVEESGDTLKAQDESSDSDNIEETDPEIAIVETEIEGVYQFGDAPSGEVSKSDDPSFSIEPDNPVEDVNGMSVIDYLYQEALKHNTGRIDISAYGISTGSIMDVLTGLINEHPDLYYVKKTLRYLPDNSIVSAVWLTYIEDLDDAAFQTEIRAALSHIKSGMNDLQKAIVLHDYLAVNCEYDYENYLAGSDNIPPMSYTTYGVFVNRAAVCQGYALAYKYLLNQVGIECYMVDSSSMNHAWNLVKIDDEFYQVDVTWDDPTWDRIGRVRHIYMFLSDESFKTAGSGHRNWQVTKGGEVVNITANDTKYDEVFWSDINSPMILAGEDWNDCYYVYYDSDKRMGKVGKRMLSDLSAEGTGVYDIGTWPVWDGGGNWLGAYSGLFQYNDRLYFNDKTSICSIDFDGTNKNTEFTIEPETADGYIYGSALCQGKVLYTLLQTPNFNGKTTVLEADIEIQEEPPVIPVESIVLSTDTLTLSEGATAELVATVTPSYATDSTITWESSDSSIAKVEGGTVTAVSIGSCIITASAGGKAAVCNVTVEKYVEEPTIIPVTGIELTPSELTLKVGGTAGLKATVIPANATNAAITWESSDYSVAEVEGGIVTAVSAGSCTITAKAGGKEAACSVTVEKTDEKPPVTTEPYIAVTKIKTSYVCGDELNIDDLTVTYYDASGAASIVTDYTTNVTDIDMSTVGTKELIVTYDMLTASVNIYVTSANKEGIKIELKDTDKTYIYTGTAIKPEIIVTNNGQPLTEGIDYTVKYSNNIKASAAAKITVTGKGNLSKSYTKLFTIEAKRLDNKVVIDDVVLDDTTSPKVKGSYVTVVEGSKISPVLTYNGIKLTSKDFKVPDEYKNYKWKLEDKDDDSKKTISVTGQGNFDGTLTLAVKIISKAEQKNTKLIVSVAKDAKEIPYDAQPKDISEMGLLTISTKDTPASELKEAKDGEDGDYIISYPDDITSAGSKKFTVTGISEKCTGTVTQSFAIKPKKTEFSVEYDKDNRGYAFVSTGTKVDDLVVKDGDTELVEGKDYKVSYSGNKKAGDTAKFTITGLGSYKGSKCTQIFTINKGVLNNNPNSAAGKTDGLKIAIADKVFKNAGVYKSSPYVSINDVLINASNYTVTYYLDNPATNPDARVMDSKNKLTNGDTTVWVKIVGKGNYAAADDTCYVTASYRVNSLASSDSYDLSKANVTFRDKDGNPIKKVEYTGEPIIRNDIKVVVTYKIGKQTVTLNEGEDYTVTFVNNVNKGKATVVITGMPNQNHYVGSKTAVFSIVANNLKSIVG